MLLIGALTYIFTFPLQFKIRGVYYSFGFTTVSQAVFLLVLLHHVNLEDMIFKARLRMLLTATWNKNGDQSLD